MENQLKVEDPQQERDRNRRDRPSRFSDQKKDRSRERRGRENRVYVSNIPYDYKWKDVKDLFREMVGEVAYVELFNDENDKPRGCGIVDFLSTDSIAKAMEVMHRYPIQGRKLVIKEDFGKVRDKHGHVVNENIERPNNPRMNRNSGPMMMRMPKENLNQLNTYGLSAHFLDSIGIQGVLGCRVFVANLDYKVDKAKLKEVFKMAGKVRNIDLSIDKDGNSRGFAVIEYDHPVEAVQAISMFDSQFLYDRKLAVRMDQKTDKQEVRLPEGLKGIGVGLGPNGEPLHDVARSIMQNMSSQDSGPGILGPGPSSMGTEFSNSMGGSGMSNNLPLQGMGISGLGSIQNQLLNQGLGKSDFGVGMSGGSPMGMRGNLDLGNPSQNGNGNMSGYRTGSIGQSNMSRETGNIYNNMDRPTPQSNTYGNRNMNSNIMADKSLDTVQIVNLPPSMTWQLIREKFSEVGDIQFAEKTAVDTAIVRYQNEWGAGRAIKMFDRTRIDGRTIEVRYY